MGHSLNRTSFRINQNLVIDDKTFNPGYILVSDAKGNASWKNPDQYMSNEEPLDHFIGELYGGGIVVAVWREQKETIYETCLIASVRNYSEPYSDGSYFYWRWSDITNLAIGATARSHTFGASNSQSIFKQGSPTGEKAATKCLQYVNEDLYGLGIYGDWYLPSTFELNCLNNNSAIVDRVIAKYSVDKSIPILDDEYNNGLAKMSLFTNYGSRTFGDPSAITGYWTSVEYNAGSAYYLNMDNGGARFATASKNSYKNVRPFRQDVKRWNGTTWVKDRRNTGVVLIVSDGVLFTNLPEYYNGVITNLTAAESSQGNTVQIITSYSLIPNDLSMYDHIWDIDVSQPNISANTAKYTTYLQQGGGLFLLGENTGFTPVRDTNIANFITTLGGGSVTFDTSFPSPNPGTCSVETEFLIANNTNTIIFGACGRFLSIGNGTTITRMSAPVGNYPIGTPNNVVIWKTGNLSLAPKGAIVVALDINFISDYAGGDTFGKYTNPPFNGRDFTANISQILNKS